MKARDVILLAAALAASALHAQLYWNFTPAADPYSGEEFSLKEILGQGPIGEADRVVVQGDAFVNAATGKPVRFWGVNINAPLNNAAAAAFYAKRGVNAARYHSSKALVDSSAPSYQLISSARLDLLHQAIANYGNEGIYTFISEVFFPLSLVINSAWGIDGYDASYTGNRQAFWVLWFDQDLKSAYRGWLVQMLAAVNPYNGRTIADDPAVACIELVNEDNLFFPTFGPGNAPAAQWRKVEAAMYDFAVTKYGSIGAAQAAWGAITPSRFANDAPAQGRLHVLPATGITLNAMRPFSLADKRRAADQIEFMAVTQREWFAEMTQVLRDNGFQGGVIASNWRTADRDAPTNQSYQQDIEYWTYTAAGVLDNHSYFSPVRSAFGSTTSIGAGDRAYAPPAVLEPRRLSVAVKQAEGHPSVVSEFSWTAPNEHRSEATLLSGAYSGLLGVDTLFWFAGESNGWAQSLSRWPLNVPSIAGLFPAAALMYRRGDVAPAPALVREGRTLASLRAPEPSLIKSIQGWDATRDAGEFTFNPETGAGAIDALALLAGRADLAFDTDADFVHPDLSGLFDAAGKWVDSFTGQLRTDFAAGLSTVDTPLTQGIAGYLGAAGAVTLSDVRLTSTNEFGSLIVTSLDGLPLAQSNKVLIQSGTRDRLTGWSTVPWYVTLGGVEFEGLEIVTVGVAPWQVQSTAANVVLLVPGRTAKRAVAVDPNLRPRNTLATVALASGIRVTLPADVLYTVVELSPLENRTPAITSRALPNAIRGRPYTARLAAAGGDGALQWSAAALPPGLSIAADGTVSGTPAAAGPFAVEATVSDADGDRDTRALPLYVIDLGPQAGENPWAGLPDSGGWKLTGIGWLNDSAWPEVYHANLGWLRVAHAAPGVYRAWHYAAPTPGWIGLLDAAWPFGWYDHAAAAWILAGE